MRSQHPTPRQPRPRPRASRKRIRALQAALPWSSGSPSLSNAPPACEKVAPHETAGPLAGPPRDGQSPRTSQDQPVSQGRALVDMGYDRRNGRVAAGPDGSCALTCLDPRMGSDDRSRRVRSISDRRSRRPRSRDSGRRRSPLRGRPCGVVDSTRREAIPWRSFSIRRTSRHVGRQLRARKLLDMSLMRELGGGRRVRSH